MFDTGPGPEDTAHLWGDYEAELALEDTPYDRTPPSRYRAPRAEPWPSFGVCTFTKRDLYPTEADADRRIGLVRDWCRASGREFKALHAERCAHADHYHLRRTK